MKPRRDALWIGFLTGLVLPFVGYAILLMIYDQLEAAGMLSRSGFSSNFRERTLALVAVCLNLIPLGYFQRRYATRSLRGLVLVTVLYGFIWFFYYGTQLM